MDDLIVLLKVLNLLHDLFENFGAVLWRIAVFYKADLDLQLQLIADVLIVQPVSKRRFGVDDLFDLLRQSLALVVDDNAINLFIGSVFKIILVPQGKENIVERLFFKGQTDLSEALSAFLHLAQNFQRMVIGGFDNSSVLSGS